MRFVISTISWKTGVQWTHNLNQESIDVKMSSPIREALILLSYKDRLYFSFLSHWEATFIFQSVVAILLRPYFSCMFSLRPTSPRCDSCSWHLVRTCVCLGFIMVLLVSVRSIWSTWTHCKVSQSLHGLALHTKTLKICRECQRSRHRHKDLRRDIQAPRPFHLESRVNVSGSFKGIRGYITEMSRKEPPM